MATQFNFTSPSVKFIEKDLTSVDRTQNLGITSFGMVGESQKGPAFEPILLTSKNDWRTRFGFSSNEKLGDKYKFLAPFYAYSFLEEGNQLWFTRVLGLSGYDAGTGWALTVSAGLDESTTASTATSTTTGATFTGGTFFDDEVPSTTGTTVTIEPEYTKYGATSFSGTEITYNVLTYDSIALSGTVDYTATTITGTSYAEYENMVVAVIRSRGLYVNNALTHIASATTLNATGATADIYGEFTLSVDGSLGTEDYTCSLDPDATNFISKVLGVTPKDKNTKLYVEATYPDLLRKLIYEGYAYGLDSTLVELSGDVFTDYETSFKTPETPYVVSEIRGNKVDRLFKFVTISDGDAANKEIKISFESINPDTKEFDVVIRDFNDTDDKVVVLERFSKCTMNPSDNNFIGRRIGSRVEGQVEMDFEIKSKYVFVEMYSETVPTDSFPCGFEGYNFRNFSATNTGSSSALTPTIMYKTSFETTDKVSRTYFGISERAYDTSAKGKGINQNYFNFQGTAVTDESITKSKGFHLDSGATANYVEGSVVIGEFETGPAELKTVLDIQSGTYSDRNARKFTFVPYGGFDGWDVHRDERTNKNVDAVGGANYVANNDYDAYLTAVNTFDNPEEVFVNVFATPGLDFSDNTTLVKEALDLIEIQRQDSLYIIDAPDLPSSTSMADEIVDLLDTADIDSSYACTYYPYIKVKDNDTNTEVFIPATGEAARVMALTDKKKFPWFAPAGIDRGLIASAIKAKRSLKESERGTLYQGKINPIATFRNVGIDIFGQKTLQTRDSALDRINVRRLLLHAKALIRDVGIRLLFDQNDDVVVDNFLNKVNPILANIKRERGLNNFKVEYSDENTPESLDNNQLFFVLKLQPTSALEELGITFEITPSSVTFND